MKCAVVSDHFGYLFSSSVPLISTQSFWYCCENRLTRFVRPSIPILKTSCGVNIVTPVTTSTVMSAQTLFTSSVQFRSRTVMLYLQNKNEQQQRTTFCILVLHPSAQQCRPGALITIDLLQYLYTIRLVLFWSYCEAKETSFGPAV